MVSAKHNTEKDVCCVVGCDKDSERSISLKQMGKSSLKLKDPNVRSALLCKEHYKTYKKETKNDRDLDKIY